MARRASDRAEAPPESPAPEKGQADLWLIDNSHFVGDGGHGIYLAGDDKSSSTSNGGRGIDDESFLGLHLGDDAYRLQQGPPYLRWRSERARATIAMSWARSFGV